MSTDVMTTGTYPDDPLPGPAKHERVMPRCKTCAHWERHFADWGWCHRISNFPKEGAWFTGNPGQNTMTTDATFGCILHQPKP